MFTRKKTVKEESHTTMRIEQNAIAKICIMNAMKEFEDLRDGQTQLAYINGLVDMAFELEIIESNDRANFTTIAYKKAQEIKAKGNPIYKKKGCYEYRGYYILKLHNMGDGAENWGIQKIDCKEMIVTDVTFKDAIKVIDKEV